MWPPATPYLQDRDVTRPTFEIVGPLYISGTVEATNFKFSMQIDHEGFFQKMKIMSKEVVTRSR